ncbi:ABC transporter ATP-binding protein [Desulfogranum marinum]|uniref:ABC transporter ATP-binding protein n=1 Tax=Desulfogranum marinum TaxID=453220 RepID=UPI001964F9F9|nr:ABC transporter ATP-binding protein [Desulfogranum marinum]MBM9511344.1 ABC transporter ATP-binding protein [Desulfogranum marinum]
MSKSQNVLLQARGICKAFHQGQQPIHVLNDIDLDVHRCEMTAIVGASGSGKTTLLQILGTLDQADSGRLLFNDTDLTTLSDNEIAAHRNANIGFIFQFHHLLPEFTAIENVIMPGLIQGLKRDQLETNAMELLGGVDLQQRSNHRTGELSGGEQQRVALARALIMKPALLFADEPTGNLDSVSGEKVFHLLRDLTNSMGLSVIMVTHNMQLAQMMDRCLTLQDGNLA